MLQHIHTRKALLLSLIALIAVLAGAQADGGGMSRVAVDSQFKAMADARRDTFCRRLHSTILSLSSDIETTDFVRKNFYAEDIVRNLNAQLQLGKIEPFQKIAAVTTPVADAEMNGNEESQYLSTAEILGLTLGTKRPLTLATSTTELRHLPAAPRGTEVLLVVSSVLELNSDRAIAITAIARRLDIRLSVLWTGALDAVTQDEAKALAFLAQATGGNFIYIGADKAVCQRLI